LAAGDHKFYNFLLTYALNKLIAIENKTYKGEMPNLEFLDYHDKFMVLYRRENTEVYLQVAKLFRKASNKIYRIMLKKGITKKNNKFLNVV
jgi:hypothetical protein